MTKLNDLSAAQLEWIIDIKHRIEILQIQLDSIGGDAGTGRPKANGRRPPLVVLPSLLLFWAKYKG